MFGRPFHLLSSLTSYLRWQVQVSTFLWMFDSCLDLDCLWKALPLSQVSQQPHSGWLSIVQKASKDPAGDIFSASIKLLVWFHLSPPSDCSAKGGGSGWRFIFLRRKTLSVQPSESRAQWQVCALQLQWTLVQTRVLLSAKLYHTVCCEATTRCKDAEQSVGRTQCSGMMQWDDDALLWCSRCALLGWRRCAIALVGKHCIGVPMVALFLGMMIWWSFWWKSERRQVLSIFVPGTLTDRWSVTFITVPKRIICENQQIYIHWWQLWWWSEEEVHECKMEFWETNKNKWICAMQEASTKWKWSW